jgi:pyruvate dehydrogenase E2 component (dihydrolipoamide acetyltransferase)
LAEFTLPNLGENVSQGDVLRVLVKQGDRIEQDQPILELETDKATLEVPSTVAGTVTEIRVKPGDKITPGQTVLLLDEDSGKSASPARAESEPESESKPESKPEQAAPSPTGEGDAPASSGGAATAAAANRAQPETAPGGEPAGDVEDEDPAEVEDAPAAADAERRRAAVVDFRGRQSAAAPVAATAMAAVPSTATAPAGPSVRRVAREIGVDISQVTGSGPKGRITDEDVKAFARQVMSSLGGGALQAPARTPAGAPALPDFSKWGEVESKPMSGVRRKTAQHLSHAWSAIPHVTQFDKADITALEEIRRTHAPEAERHGGKLTVTAVITKIVASALHRFPQFNASIDPGTESIIYKTYVNVGIAVDTEHGLLVPVVRHADQKNILQIAADIQQLAQKAKARKLSLDEMSGGSMSITNLGGIGGTAFTPIVNWPEVAILGISRASVEAVYRDGAFQPRQMLPLSLSYDHRAIDGADAIRFLRWVIEAIEQPFTVMLRG